MIEIRGTLVYNTVQLEPSEDAASGVVRQIAYDAISGTFGEFPDYWKDKWEESPQNLAPHEVKQQDKFSFTFKLNLPEKFFEVEPAGLQHLIGVLAGDLFYLKIPDSPIKSITISEVTLPDTMKNVAIDKFRSHRAHDIESIRSEFKLGSRPLLAFSFKPRLGIKSSAVATVTLDVLKNGFNLVELDTRNLILDGDRIQELVELSARSSQIGGGSHVTRFSPNLSVPADLICDFTERFAVSHESPVVIKIDGGLDGISSCQAVRRKFSDGKRPTPIVTCYPLLRNQLSNRVPSQFFTEALGLSGVDILYPGGRPSLGIAGRTLGTSETGQLISSVKRYHDIVRSGWPMPSVAGGVYVGELHAFYELLGPKVAFFLGGAVALHKGGPVAGARLCAEVLDEAVELRRQTPNGELVPDLSDALVKRIEDAYERTTSTGNKRFAYISPKQLLTETPGLVSWFKAQS